MKIKIDNKDYVLNIEEAFRLGVIQPSLPEIHEFRRGDIFVSILPHKINAFILVQCLYDVPGDCSWQLLGIGLSPNSGSFFNKLHTLTEIRDYLSKNNMIRAGNIDSQVEELIAKFERN